MSEHSSRDELKHHIDSMLFHDFQILLRTRPSDLNGLQTYKNNELMMQYIKQIYNQYNIPNPLLQVNLSCLSSCPSGVKTIKKQKMTIMSSQTLKYSVTPRKLYEDHEDAIDCTSYQHEHDHSQLCFYHNTTHSSLGYLYRQAKEQQLNKTSLIDLYHYYGQGGRKMHICDSEESEFRVDMRIQVEEKVEMADSVDNVGYVLPCPQDEEKSSACSDQSDSSSGLAQVRSNECRTHQKTAGFSNSLANSAKTRAFSPQFNAKLHFGQSSFMDSEFSQYQ